MVSSGIDSAMSQPQKRKYFLYTGATPPPKKARYGKSLDFKKVLDNAKNFDRTVI